MTRRTLVVALIATSFSSLMHGAEPGPKAGFRFFKWGDSPAREMVAMNLKKGGMDAYLIHQDDMQIAGGKASALTYFFFRKRLCRVEANYFFGPPQFTTQTGSMLEFARIGTMLEHEWGAPDDVSTINPPQVDNEHWLSPDGKTDASLGFIPRHPADSRPFTGVLVDLIIEDRECVRQAVNGAGV